MHWLYFLGSLASLGLAMIRTLPSFAVLVLLAAALGFMVAFLLGWVNSRISSSSRDVSHIMSADELRQLREQAQARKAAQSGGDDSTR
jgi:predicted PurR-regulated permease PerM